MELRGLLAGLRAGEERNHFGTGNPAELWALVVEG